MLEIKQISKAYSKAGETVRALDGVSLKVDPGEFVVVQGPSGCGKTTLLLAAGGLLAPDAGQVLIEQRDPYALSPERRAELRAQTIGFVFQQFHLIPYLTVEENVRAPSLAISRERTPQSRGENLHKRAAELIEHFQLSNRARHLPSELSTGERQRTALARAMLNQPQIVLADEPTGNLDPDNASIVLRHLAEFARQGGAVLLVTHDDMTEENVDRIIRLRQGKVVADEVVAE